MGGDGERSRRVLLVDDDHDLVEVVTAALDDEGYEVVVPDALDPDQIERAVNRYEPDCVLLDSASRIEYGASWEAAARISRRVRRVPTVMFTAHVAASDEAEEKISDRAKAAGFAAVLRKPFGLDELLSVVGGASASSTPFDVSAKAERGRTRALVAELERAGALDIRPSLRREWANFRSPAGREMQLYWWQNRGQYLVGRYTADGARLMPVGRYFTTRDAVEAAMAPESPTPQGVS